MNDNSPQTEKLKGKAKSVAGKATGNKDLEAEGKTDQVEAHGRQAAETAKHTARRAADSLKNGPQD